MTRSNKTFTNFILQSLQNPTTFVGHSQVNMHNIHLYNTAALTGCTCCCICCMP
jgi:hypothetical protein